MHIDNNIMTPYGFISGITAKSFYENGAIKELMLNEKNVVITHAGELIPFYSEETPRRKYKSCLTYHQNGMVKSVSLNEQQDIITPIGEFPAELVTFYDSGELKRFFPLDGKISGFWSEEDERNLNIPFNFEFYFSSFTAMLVGICFYKSGDIRSLTLFPGETILVATKNYGEFKVKTGFSLYENGNLKSIEPAVPTPVTTKIGCINAYDVNAVGINADSNSIEFDEEGSIISLVTSSDRIAVKSPEGVMKFITPIEVKNPLSEDESTLIPVKLDFNYAKNTVTITNDKSHVFDLDKSDFSIFKGSLSPTCSPSDCASCSLCSH